jgi:ketosteroid isomerase-like protein
VSARSNLETLKAAYAAAGEGDVSALSDLFAPDTVWTGIERGFFWWKHAPS